MGEGSRNDLLSLGYGDVNGYGYGMGDGLAPAIVWVRIGSDPRTCFRSGDR